MYHTYVSMKLACETLIHHYTDKNSLTSFYTSDSVRSLYYICNMCTLKTWTYINASVLCFKIPTYRNWFKFLHLSQKQEVVYNRKLNEAPSVRHAVQQPHCGDVNSRRAGASSCSLRDGQKVAVSVSSSGYVVWHGQCIIIYGRVDQKRIQGILQTAMNRNWLHHGYIRTYLPL